MPFVMLMTKNPGIFLHEAAGEASEEKATLPNNTAGGLSDCGESAGVAGIG